MPTDDSEASDTNSIRSHLDRENSVEVSEEDSLLLSFVSELTIPSSSGRSTQSQGSLQSLVSQKQSEPKREANVSIEETNARPKQRDAKKETIFKNDSEFKETFNELNEREKKVKIKLATIKQKEKRLQPSILCMKKSLINSLNTDINNERIICEKLEERLKKLEALYPRDESERNSNSNEKVKKQ